MISNPLDSVTPSSLTELMECGHRFALRRRGFERRATSAPIVLGNIAHSVFASVLTARPGTDDFQECFLQTWHDAQSQAAHDYKDLGRPESWHRYSIVRRGTKKVLQRLLCEVADGKITLRIEHEIRGSGEAVWGRPDLLLVDGADCDIVELKTGSWPNGVPPLAHIRQVQLYALIAHRLLGLHVRSGRLEPVDGSPYLVDVSQRVLEALDIEAKSVIASFNESSQNSELVANPGVSCVRCPVVADCNVFWKTSGEGVIGVEGTIVRLQTLNTVQALWVDNGENERLVIGVPVGVGSLNQRVRIAHLRMIGDSNLQWRSGISTLRQVP